MMKIKLAVILAFLILKTIGQVDTMTWDYSKLQLINQKYTDGYHIFKKNDIKIKEYRLVNGKLDGTLKDYYDNGNPKAITEFRPYYNYNISYYAGIFKEFYESGKLKLEGKYEHADSIECVSCFDLYLNKKTTKAQSRSKRIDLWKEYYENGQLKSIGLYNGIHETHYIHYPKPTSKMGAGVFTPGDYSEEYLKDKSWKYFNDKGELIKDEFYYQGILCSVQEYDR